MKTSFPVVAAAATDVADAMADATLVLRMLLLLYNGPHTCCASACVAIWTLFQRSCLNDGIKKLAVMRTLIICSITSDLFTSGSLTPIVCTTGAFNDVRITTRYVGS